MSGGNNNNQGFWARRNSLSLNRKKKPPQDGEPKAPASTPANRSMEDVKQDKSKSVSRKTSQQHSQYLDADSLSKKVVMKVASRVRSQSVVARRPKESSSRSSSKSSSHSIHKRPVPNCARNTSLFNTQVEEKSKSSPSNSNSQLPTQNSNSNLSKERCTSTEQISSTNVNEESVREIDRPFLRSKLVNPSRETVDDCITAESPKSIRGGTDPASLAVRLKKFAKLVEACTLKQLMTEFESLSKPNASEYQTFSKMQSKNDVLKKNRYSNIFCLDATRVTLKFRSRTAEDSYIHANRVEYENLDNSFIITQGPVTATIGDFWRMVWQENVQIVVQLCRATENGVKKCAEYFERKRGSYAVWGDIYVATIAVESDASMVKTTIQLNFSSLPSRRVTHYQWLEWEDCKAPPTSNETLFDLLAVVRGCETPVVVHCSAGIGRSGTLVAAEMCLMDMHKGKTVSVLAAVECLRRFRCQTVQTLDQYLYLHRVILQYGESNGYLKKEEVAKFYKLYAESIRRK